MKLTKTSAILLVVVVLVIAGVYLGMRLSSQNDEHKKVQQNLAAAQKRLTSLNNEPLAAQKEQLKLEVEDHKAQTALVRQHLVSPEDSVSATDLILETARDRGVDIVRITSPGESKGSLAGTQCITLPVGIEARGEFGTIREFVRALTEVFPTSLVTSVQAKAASHRSDDEEEEKSAPVYTYDPTTDPVTARISLVIYSYGTMGNVE